MHELHWSNWATGNAHDLRGPRYIPPGTRAVGLSAKEQHSFGVVDIRLIFQGPGGAEDETDGATRLPDGTWRDVHLPSNQGTIFGIIVHEQHGHGVIDIQLRYRDENGAEHETEGATGNDEANDKITLDLLADFELTGFECHKQNGYGVVDVRIHGTKYDQPPSA